MGNNPYNSPEKFGLRLIGDEQWGDAFYNFDMTAVWIDGDGQYYYADDSGCSCPAPFEDYTDLADLEKASQHEVIAHLNARRLWSNTHPNDGLDLMERIRAIG